MANPNVGPTVYGVETEYSCTITYPGDITYEFVGACHAEDSELELFERPDKKNVDKLSHDSITNALDNMGIRRTTPGGMLSNGGRLYIDPSGPEYCTPETATAEDAALRTFDGDDIAFNILNLLRDQGDLSSFQLNRRIVDHNRSSRGIHLNTTTTIPTSAITRAQGRALAALNVAKGAIFGSGGLLLDETGQTDFYHSPRLALTNMVEASYASYSKRPLIRAPFKDDVGCWRVETVTSDALNFAWPLRASLVATNALFKLFELGYDKELPALRDPVRASHVVGRLGAGSLIAVQTGAKEFEGMPPLSILLDVVELALTVDEEHEHLDAESKQVLKEIVMVADLITTRDERAATQVESIARLRRMKARMEAEKTDIGSVAMCRYDYYWDKIGGGLAEQLREKGAGWLGFKDRSIHDKRKRLVTPPQNTRAVVRADLIAIGAGNQITDWSAYKTPDGKTHHIKPLSTKLTNSLS